MPSSLAERFRRTLKTHVDTSGDTLTPSILCRASARTLGRDGVGISLAGETLRLPLGASSPEVSIAEELQTTLGDGPCLSAARDRRPLLAHEETLAIRWPLYHQGLVDRTPFRSVAAVPLSGPEGTFGAMNLYANGTSDDNLPPLEMVQRDVVEPALALMLGLFDDLHGLQNWSVSSPGGPERDRITRRIDVWTAVGMLMEAAGEDDETALALLRSSAFRRGQSLDAIAQQLIRHDVSSAELLGEDGA